MTEEGVAEKREFITVGGPKFMICGDTEVELITSRFDYENNLIFVTVRFPDGKEATVLADRLREKSTEETI